MKLARLGIALCAGLTLSNTPAVVEEPHSVASSGSSQEDSLETLLAELGVTLNRTEACLELAGWRNQTEGAVEVLACTPGGKTHESVLVLDCVPHGLHAGLLALGLGPGAPARVDEAGAIHPPEGARVSLTVRWTDAEGEVHELPASALVCHARSREALEETDWVFTGSILTRNAGETVYAADETGTLAGTYWDAANPLELPGEAGKSDDAWHASPDRGPALGERLTLIVRTGEVR